MRQSKYDFDTIIDRRNTDSIKWNVAENVLPMWVADMDFRTAPEILDALKIRLDHGVFGYADVPEAWYNAYINWWDRRHNLKMEKENLIFSAGVMPSIFSLIKRFAAPSEMSSFSRRFTTISTTASRIAVAMSLKINSSIRMANIPLTLLIWNGFFLIRRRI